MFLYKHHYVKSVLIWSFSCPYFPAFGLNTKRYFVSLCIQSECGKLRTRKSPNTDTFHTVHIINIKGAIRPCNQRYVKGCFIDFLSSHSSGADHRRNSKLQKFQCQCKFWVMHIQLFILTE